ncbi:2-phospho-L-lactate transferase [Billgrantia gudaonensis]|uniref:LPPG:FO 2-phospho-L-lactate transferase n=1 Tax=Billgrantia gudaonensis TaxID=376427 RepID=A0A1G8Q2F9_9GAMM|nr:2-phospho-L-lactate transferase [Halomonas gudaonensis]SDI98716.1 LPPG:FO 2-phospho-L-lactate transferase [Halomonas gudaonensis]
MTPRVTLLAGGVGGAKLAEGLAAVCSPERLSIIGNVADDQEFHGLWVSPDIDTLTYSLANLIDRRQGWGLADESHRVLAGLERLGCDTWMSLGDRDMATHIFRTQLRHQGVRPSAIAQRIAESLGVDIDLLLPTDDPLQTTVKTEQGWLAFQEYFVRERCRPEVLEVRFEGAATARPTSEALAAIETAEVLLIAPSNPVVSIAPILAVPGIRRAIETSRATRVAVSPLIGGRTVKGPADRMLTAMGYPCSNLGVAESYAGLLDGLVIDASDRDDRTALEAEGVTVLTTDTLMTDAEEKARLAGETLAFAGALRREEVEA